MVRASIAITVAGNINADFNDEVDQDVKLLVSESDHDHLFGRSQAPIQSNFRSGKTAAGVLVHQRRLSGSYFRRLHSVINDKCLVATFDFTGSL